MYGHAPHAACRPLLPPPSAAALVPAASAATLLTTSAARLRHRESSFVSTLCGSSVPCGSSTYLRGGDTRRGVAEQGQLFLPSETYEAQQSGEPTTVNASVHAYA